ncbi:MAG: carbohydrate ABC transporter permease [Oscillospiraceae bacterium]
MTIKKRPLSERRTFFDYLNYLLLLIIAFACFVPVLHVVMASFSEPAKLATHAGLIWRPLGELTFKGYQMVFNDRGILNGYLNTIFYVVTGTALSIFLTTLGAYVCSRRNALFARHITLMITFTMFFSGGLIPFYLVVNKLGLTNTRLAMILPWAISVWNLIIMRTSMQELPASVVESAQIDGANDFVILFRIIVPLIKPVLAVMVLYYAVGQWNSWFGAMVFLRERSLYPLQLILREILIQNDTSQIMTQANMGGETNLYKNLIKYCTTVVATVPILCIYPFLQKYFVKGVMIGSIKG